jgi:Domain of unknown function (DUF4271)
LKPVSLFIFLLFWPLVFFAQLPADSPVLHKDSVVKTIAVKRTPLTYDSSIQRILRVNHFLNTTGKPVAVNNILRKTASSNIAFYILMGVVAILAFLRFFYAQYFTNLFRVFFNTSLRQSQLKDQLLQAQLASLLYNLFFVVVSGTYIYLLFRYFGWIRSGKIDSVLPLCIACLALVYLVKYLVLKFTGWLTGYTEVVDNYLFVIFLINKIIGIFLVPVLIVMAFSDITMIRIAVSFSLLCIGLMMILRVLRSYGLLEHQLKMNYFQFLLYVVGIEVLPLLLIYHGAILLLSKNL